MEGIFYFIVTVYVLVACAYFPVFLVQSPFPLFTIRDWQCTSSKRIGNDLPEKYKCVVFTYTPTNNNERK